MVGLYGASSTAAFSSVRPYGPCGPHVSSIFDPYSHSCTVAFSFGWPYSPRGFAAGHPLAYAALFVPQPSASSNSTDSVAQAAGPLSDSPVAVGSASVITKASHFHPRPLYTRPKPLYARRCQLHFEHDPHLGVTSSLRSTEP